MLSQDIPLHARLGLPCALKLSDTESGCACELGCQLNIEGGSAEPQLYCSHFDTAEGNQYHY